jgi:hypothetical protein
MYACQRKVQSCTSGRAPAVLETRKSVHTLYPTSQHMYASYDFRMRKQKVYRVRGLLYPPLSSVTKLPRIDMLPCPRSI